MKQGWEIKKLGEVCAKLTDGSHNPPKGVNHGNFIMLSSQNIFNDYLSYDDVRFLQEEDFIREDKRTCVREGDVLLTIVGTIGRCAVFTGSKNVTLQRSVAVLHPHESLLSRFLMYCLIGRNTSLNEQAHGIAQKGIYLKQLALITIPVPPLPEQEKIVSELDCLSGILDKKRQQLKELDALAQSIFYEMFGDPVTNERGWEVKKLGEVCDIINGFAFPSSAFAECNPIKAIKITNVGVNEFVHDDSSLPNQYNSKEDYKVHTGDIVIALTRTVISTGLKRAIIPKEYNNALVNQRVAAIITDNKVAEKNFIYSFLGTDFVKEYVLSHATALMQPNLSIKDLRELPIITPPLPLQESFATKIEAIEAQKALIKQSLGEVETLFNARMQEYFG